MLRFLFGWFAWELTASAFWVGTIAGLMLMPALVLSPLFGVLADQINPRNGLLATVGLQGMLAAITALIHALDVLTLQSLAVLALAFGVVTSAHTPIRLAMLPRLVERGALPSAIGYSAMVFNSSRILGPALGAWMLTVSSVTMVFAASATFMGLAVLLLLRVSGLTEVAGSQESPALLAQLREGVRYAVGHTDLRLVFTLTLASGLLGRTFIELLPAVSGALLDGDATTLAILTAGAGAGSILGGLIVSRQGGRTGQLYRLVLSGLSLAALVLLSMSLWGALPVVAVAVGCVSLATTVVGTGNQALTQLMIDESYRGRVMSLWTVVAMGTPAVGAVLLGTLADRVGFVAAMALPAVAVLVLVMISRQVLIRQAGS